MKRTSLNARRLARHGVAAGVLTAALIAAPTVAQDDGAPEPPTITMKAQGKRLLFDGPATVRKGEELRIVNDTSVAKHGPHSFSLAKDSVLPKTVKQFKECFTPGKLCLEIALAHKFNPKTEKVAKPIVEVGGKGWNRSFNGERAGDSWYTETKGESYSRRVTASAGKTLSFICAVHPDMQGKIKVLPAE